MAVQGGKVWGDYTLNISIRRLCHSFAAVLVFYTGSATAGFEKAMALYQAKDFEHAYSAFQVVAGIGDARAQFNLGVMYFRGEYVAQDLVQAYAWLVVAGKSGFTRGTELAEKILNSFDADNKSKARAAADKLLLHYDPDTIKENIFPEWSKADYCLLSPKSIKQELPKYPRKELRLGAMGITRLSFTISPEGYARDIVVVEHSGDKFSKVTANAAKRWRYKPPSTYGVRKIMHDYHMKISFQIKGYYSAGVSPIDNVRVRKEIRRLDRKAHDGDPLAQYQYANLISMLQSYKKYLKHMDLPSYDSADKWYLKAAEQGLRKAQLRIGINIRTKESCKDHWVEGYQWIHRAALAGHPEAQLMLARHLIYFGKTDSAKKSSLTWLRNAALSNYLFANVLLAWELVTADDKSMRNAEEALSLLAQVPDDYLDMVRVFETKAAAHAEAGDFEKAVELQQQAIKETKDLEWEIPVMQQRLNAYQVRRTWRGHYYAVEN